MDIALLVTILAPCLPFLMGLGQKAVEKGAEKLGEKGAEGLLPQVRKIWEKLHPKVEAKAAAKEAAEDVAKSPDDADAVAASYLFDTDVISEVLKKKPALLYMQWLQAIPPEQQYVSVIIL